MTTSTKVAKKAGQLLTQKAQKKGQKESEASALAQAARKKKSKH